MRTNARLAMLLVFVSLASGCSGKEELSQPAETAPAPATPADAPEALKTVGQQSSGDYLVTLLNETGFITQGANRFTLEFRHGSGAVKDLTVVKNLQLQLSTEMPGMAPMPGTTSLVPAHDVAGRYIVESSSPAMTGMWKLLVTFDHERVEFSATVHPASTAP